MSIREKVSGERSESLKEVWIKLGYAYELNGQAKEAKEAKLKAKALEDTYEDTDTFLELAEEHTDQRQYAKAIEDLKLALGIRERLHGDKPELLIEVWLKLGDAYELNEQAKEAKEARLKAKALEETREDKDKQLA